MLKDIFRLFYGNCMVNINNYTKKSINKDKNTAMLDTIRDIAFIAWMEDCMRSKSLSSYLNAKQLFLPRFSKTTGTIRFFIVPFYYLYNFTYTILWLIKTRPKVIFAQSPPLFCPFAAFIYKLIFKAKIVCDCHNAFFDGIWDKIPGYNILLKKSDVVLVHNDEFSNYLKSKMPQVNFFSLPDKLIDYSLSDDYTDINYNPYFLIIVGFKEDEPIDNILNAASKYCSLHDDIKFKVTGNYKRNNSLFLKYKDIKGIEFTGYIPEEVYLSLLTNAFAVIAISTRKMIQQCASVESLSLSVPLILSSSETNENLFSNSVVYTDYSPNAIYNAIIEMRKKRDMYKNRIIEQKKVWHESWNNRFNDLINMMDL